MNAPVKIRVPVQSTRRARLFTTFGGPRVTITDTTPFSDLTGVVYAKPNVTSVPPTACKFWSENSPPPNLAHIYTTAAGSTPGNAVNSNHTGWPPNTTKSKFDVNLGSFGFQLGDIVAIAFHIDDSVNANPPYTYHFTHEDGGGFNPYEALVEGDSTESLSWIEEDDFTGGIVYGVGKVVVVVCPMIRTSAPFNLIPYSLSITPYDTDASADLDPTIFDPKIKNDG